MTQLTVIGSGVAPLSKHGAVLSIDLALPLTIPGLVAWYDCSDLSTITKDGSDLVSKIADKSGLGNHLLMAVGTNQPLWIAASQNLLDIVRFDGVDNFMRLDAFASGDLTQPNTFLRSGTQEGGSGKVIIDGAGVNTKRNAHFSSATSKHAIYSGSTITDAVNIDGFEQQTTLFSGAGSTIRIDEVETLASNAGTQALEGLTMGADEQTPELEWSACDIGELIVYNADISDANRTLLEEYLAAKWAT